MISITQVNPAPLIALKNLYGGTIGAHKRKEGNQRQVWVWRIQGKFADKFLIDIQPYLMVKYEEVELALEFHRSFWPQNKKHGKVALTEDEVNQRESLKNRLSSLKRREFYETA